MHHKFKTVICLLLAIVLVSLSGCATVQKVEDIEGDLGDLTPCEQLARMGEDPNMDPSCLYKELEGGRSVMLYLPEDSFDEYKEVDGEMQAVNPETGEATGNLWAKVNGFNTFVSEENYNVDYFMKMLAVHLFGTQTEMNYSFEDNDTTVVVTFSESDMTSFAKIHQLPTGDEELDRQGICQVLAQCVADTIFQAFPDLNVKEVVGGVSKITDINDHVLISKETYWPYYFGSEANYIGDTSYEDFVGALEDSGVTFNSYSGTQKLYIVNTFAHQSVLSAEGEGSGN